MFSNRVALCAATWFGAGYMPRAPGTAGALAAVPLHWGLMWMGAGAEAAAIVLIVIVGIWSAQRIHEASGVFDPQIVVIDEVAGVLIALDVAGASASAQVVAFGAFRLFDIFKPWPISRLEHLRPEGVGIMADDIGAGFAAAVCVWLWSSTVIWSA